MQIHPALFKSWCISFFKKRAAPATTSPKPIPLFPGETEILRRGTILVTDTRLAYIDPFDRMLKTYMFEHMISLNKRYYRATQTNHRFCKLLLIVSSLMLALVILIDLVKETSPNYTVVYFPIILGIFIGLLVWRDMRPKFTVQWKMRDGTTDKISIEPLFREWICGKGNREEFMDSLTQAMSQALSGKSWWPAPSQQSINKTEDTKDDSEPEDNEKPKLRLITDNYQ
ncbi:hypothetical protein AB833_16900 [Chromatiales bacterium (ex Bugula neritina AB1)]|nr:hypothetical protein AB833_16900 [Chromatiales bacterium (ex Bugula neritina AB1)]